MPTAADVIAGTARWACDTGDALDWLRGLPAASVHCCVTSPPYWGLRSYLPDGHPDKAKEIGTEPTPAEYVAKLVAVFGEVRRVLHPSGTLWLNIGDSYCTKPMGNSSTHDPKYPGGRNRRSNRSEGNRRNDPASIGCKHKDLVGIPWMVAFALRDAGWWLRQDVIWHKPAPMPSSVKDRCTTAHEYLFLLSKAPRYFFDGVAISEPAKSAGKAVKTADGWDTGPGSHGSFHKAGREKGKNTGYVQPATRQKRSVWRVATRPYKGAHFATFPPALVEPCVLAGTSAAGVCPGCGEPWRRLTARTRVATRPGTDTKVFGGPNSRFRKSFDPKHPTELDGKVVGNRDPKRHVTVVETTGWEPGCKCGAGDPAAAVVIDPFAGSGTTLAVAVGLGRRAAGHDLDGRNLALVAGRMAAVCPDLPGVG